VGLRFERLDAWHKAIDFADAMFSLADSLPQRYQFSLGEPLRRAEADGLAAMITGLVRVQDRGPR
jgi:hypothetical protein